MYNSIKALYLRVPLVYQIIAGLFLGIALAYFFPTQAEPITLFGDLFIKALKSVAPILVLILVMTAIAGHNSGQKTGFKTILVLYVISTFAAACAATIASFIWPITIRLDGIEAATGATPKNVSEVLMHIILWAIDNPIKALEDANYIAILVWAIVFGVVLKKASPETKSVLKDISAAVTGVVKIVIRFAPLGVMGLVFASCTAEGGFSNLAQFAKLIVLLVSVILVSFFVINPILVYLVSRKNPYPLVWKCLTESAYFAFFTRSSAANIPVNMALCDKMGVPRHISALSIPLGATINMAGAAITVSILTLAAVFTISGTEIDFLTALLLCVVSSICACGASGVAGGSLMLIPLACSLFNIGNDIAMQVVGVGMVIGVIQDSCETALNSSTDALFTIAVSERLKKKAEQ